MNEAVSNLSPAEKLRLIGELWDDLSNDPLNVPVHAWQKEELDRRKAELVRNPDSAITEDALKARLRERRGS